VKIAIVGGGIGGLSAAIALAGDHEVSVFERAEEFTAIGAGIVVSANAGRALRSIGVDLDGVGRRVSSSTLARADGTSLQRLELGADAHRWGETVAISRTDLHRRLASALPSSVSVRLGRRIESVDPDRPAITIDGERHEFDLLIGADGINSCVRAAMPERSRVVPAHLACWRTLVDVSVDGDPVEYVGTRRRLGVVGLGNSTYLYLVESAEPGARRASTVADLRSRFSEFTSAGQLLGAVESPPRFDDLMELDRPTWGTARAVLIGDAAHAMTPNLGQGASMAIEDAVALARSVRADDAGWFDRFVAERDPRVRWVQLTSRRLGKLLHVGPAPARHLRDALLRHVPAAVARRQTERLLGEGPVPAAVG
jgi:2-polyprenyl-6-methoxyphenol hydroxylase-like FAD-dependent oxidoreductase